MEKERTRGILTLIGGILILLVVVTHFMFDDIGTDKSPYWSSILLTLIGLHAMYVGYQTLKK